MAKLKAIDLFSGIGGIRLGLQRAGFEVIFSNDNDPYCKITFETFFKDRMDGRDIAKINPDEIPNHDLLAAGFPCQPFSQAGHQKGFEDPRGSLFFALANIIKIKRPKAFLLENVRNLKSHDGGNTFKRILYELEDKLGYTVYPEVLNSMNYGLPQKRERMYIVGFRDEVNFDFPKPVTRHLTISDILEENVDETYFLSQKYYEGLVKHRERHRSKGSGFGFEILKPDGIAYSLLVGNMGRERNLIQDEPREDFYKVGDDKAVRKNELGVRKLTIRECARLQGFPEDFDFPFPVSRTQAYKQLGNTVSVPVIRALAEKIRVALLREKSIENSVTKVATQKYLKENEVAAFLN